MKNFKHTCIAIGAATLVMLSACEEENNFQDGLNIADVGQAFDSNGDIARAAYKRANSDGSLTAVLSTSSLTAFLPTDQAFKNAGYFSTESVGEGDAAVLKSIFLYHVMEGAKRAEDLSGGDAQTLAPGKNISLVVGDEVRINGLGNQGKAATVTSADANVSNGFMHVIDGLLLPASRKVTDITIQNGAFDLLEAALIKADLVTTLAGAGPFTLFAPTDDAFVAYLEIPTKNPDGSSRLRATIQADAVAKINSLDPNDLEEILTYHVVSGNIESDDFTAGSLTTVNGSALAIALDDDGNLKSVTGIGNVDDDGDDIPSNPVQLDVIGSNGVIQIVDQILKPE